MNYKAIRKSINSQLDSLESSKHFLTHNIGIDVTRGGKFKVRQEERTPSSVINQRG